MIKDHKTDNTISFIQLTDNLNENKELAELIIETIETYIEENDDTN